LSIDEYSINNSFFTEVKITLNELNSEKTKVENVLDAVKNILAAGEDSESYPDRERIMAM
jgi:paraquat-inducible protein B